jgi:hypothetical protein
MYFDRYKARARLNKKTNKQLAGHNVILIRITHIQGLFVLVLFIAGHLNYAFIGLDFLCGLSVIRSLLLLENFK